MAKITATVDVEEVVRSIGKVRKIAIPRTTVNSLNQINRDIGKSTGVKVASMFGMAASAAKKLYRIPKFRKANIKQLDYEASGAISYLVMEKGRSSYPGEDVVRRGTRNRARYERVGNVPGQFRASLGNGSQKIVRRVPRQEAKASGKWKRITRPDGQRSELPIEKIFVNVTRAVQAPMLLSQTEEIQKWAVVWQKKMLNELKRLGLT